MPQRVVRRAATRPPLSQTDLRLRWYAVAAALLGGWMMVYLVGEWTRGPQPAKPTAAQVESAERTALQQATINAAWDSIRADLSSLVQTAGGSYRMERPDGSIRLDYTLPGLASELQSKELAIMLAERIVGPQVPGVYVVVRVLSPAGQQLARHTAVMRPVQ